MERCAVLSGGKSSQDKRAAGRAGAAGAPSVLLHLQPEKWKKQEGSRKATIMDLILISKNELVDGLKVSSTLRESNHIMLKFIMKGEGKMRLRSVKTRGDMTAPPRTPHASRLLGRSWRPPRGRRRSKGSQQAALQQGAPTRPPVFPKGAHRKDE